MAGLRWGVIGATVIGREWMVGAIREAGGDIVAVMSQDADRSRAYAAEFGIPHAVTSLPALFAAGLHVLCEKPLATTLEDARAMVVASGRDGVISLAVALAARQSAGSGSLAPVVSGL